MSSTLFKDIKAKNHASVKEKEFKIMGKKLLNRMGPKWFQELSVRQLQAADELFSKLHEDLIIGTINNCQEILLRIGLKPIIHPKQLKMVIEMSQGNSLIFLWFLNEAFYTTKPKGYNNLHDYSLNERLIFSCICHLDMIVTLRQLDRILPKMQKPVINKKKKVLPICSHKYFSPYIEPIPRAKPIENFKVKPKPLTKPDFSLYDKYLDSNFVGPDELNRWWLLKESSESTELINEVKNLLNTIINQAIHQSLLESKQKIPSNPKELLKAKIATQIEADVEKLLTTSRICKIKTMKPISIKNDGQHQFNKASDNGKTDVCESYQNVINLHYPGKRKFTYFDLINGTNNNSYKIHYEKIFNGFLNNALKKDPVMEAIQNALDINKTTNLDDAVENYLKDTWQNECKKIRDSFINNSFTTFETEIQIKSHSKAAKILKIAFEHMKRNSFFILASLPDAHKLKFLQEWIIARYGYIFPHSYRTKLWNQARKYMTLIQNRSFKFHAPKIETAEKAQVEIEKLTKSFHNQMIYKGQVLWSIMEPYLCGKSKMKETFFVYNATDEYSIPIMKNWKTKNQKTFKRS